MDAKFLRALVINGKLLQEIAHVSNWDHPPDVGFSIRLNKLKCDSAMFLDDIQHAILDLHPKTMRRNSAAIYAAWDDDSTRENDELP